MAADETPARSTCSVVGDPRMRLASSLTLTLAATLSALYVIGHARGRDGALAFVACYAMELSLSVDNMFAFYLIFQYFKCPEELQSTALTWGIVGAIMLRAVALVAGSAAVHAVKPLMLLFAVALFWSAIQMGFFGGDDDEEENVGDTRIVRLVQRMIPVTNDYAGSRLFAREDGKLRATPLFLVLVTIEMSDIVFAVDSVPAVLGMTSDTLIVYLAVMCAVLSLRSVYTITVMLIRRFVYLQPAVALLLGFIGTKITLSVLLGKELSTGLSLAIIGGTLGTAVLMSLLAPTCSAVLLAAKQRLGLWRTVGTPFVMAVHKTESVNMVGAAAEQELRELVPADDDELEAQMAQAETDGRPLGAAAEDGASGGACDPRAVDGSGSDKAQLCAGVAVASDASAARLDGIPHAKGCNGAQAVVANGNGSAITASSPSVAA